MKCAACGYEYIRQSRWVDDVVRYKQGKRKGEVKKIDQKEIVFEVGHAPFIELRYRKEVDELVYKDGYYEKTADLYACPECGTVRIDA